MCRANSKVGEGQCRRRDHDQVQGQGRRLLLQLSLVMLMSGFVLPAATAANSGAGGSEPASVRPPGANASAGSWDDWASRQGEQSEGVAVQNRAVMRAGRFQLAGPSFGLIERQDFYTTPVVSLGLRYHFSELHGWEIVRLHASFPSENALATQIRQQTNYQPDVQISRFQLSSSYVFTPIYGKYAWGLDHLVYFDVYGLAGAGLRRADDLQPFLELGLGMNHYAISRDISIAPEFRERIYSEKRTTSVVVFESVIQVGVAWLL